MVFKKKKVNRSKPVVEEVEEVKEETNVEEVPTTAGRKLKIKIGKGPGKNKGDVVPMMEYERMKAAGFDVDAIFE